MIGAEVSEDEGHAKRPRPKRTAWLIVLGVFVVACFALAWISRTQVGQALLRLYVPSLARRQAAPAERREPLPEFTFDVTRTPMPWMKPGTNVVDLPADEWTHLVIRNDVEVTAGDSGPRRDNLNKLLSVFSLATVADVEPARPRRDYHMLGKLAMGWCVEIDGRPTVVSSSTYGNLGAELSTLESFVLAMQELQCEQTTHIIARSAVTILYEVEYYFAYDDEHRVSRLRYAALVHPRSGELAVLMWLVAPEDAEPPGGRIIRRLPDNFITTYHLRLMPKQGSGLALPSAEDVALLGLPQVPETTEVDPELAPLLYAKSYTAESAKELQTRCWKTLGWE